MKSCLSRLTTSRFPFPPLPWRSVGGLAKIGTSTTATTAITCATACSITSSRPVATTTTTRSCASCQNTCNGSHIIKLQEKKRYHDDDRYCLRSQKNPVNHSVLLSSHSHDNQLQKNGPIRRHYYHASPPSSRDTSNDSSSKKPIISVASDNNCSNNNDTAIPETLQTVAQWIQESAAAATTTTRTRQEGANNNEDNNNNNNNNDPKILVLCGAGVSVAAGLPDFRSPGTGLYDNLQRYNLPYPEAVFDLEYYRERPQAFMSLAKEIWPGLQQQQHAQEEQGSRDGFKVQQDTDAASAAATERQASSPSPSPTLAHSFLALLEQKNLLLRCYTQNIDGLEFLGGVSASRMVECHGHFRTAHCIDCGAKADIEIFKEFVRHNATEPPICEQCFVGFVKPDIVFFGEMLPNRVHLLLGQDLAAAELLIIMGTSLHVAPVSTIPDSVALSCRRVLLNHELVGNLNVDESNQTYNQGPQRDLFHAGDCDESVLQISRALGWEDELLQQNEMTTSISSSSYTIS